MKTSIPQWSLAMRSCNKGLFGSLFFLLIFSFRAGLSGVWSTPVDLSAAGADAAEPKAALNDAGQAVAVWVRGGVVQAATLSFGGSWSAAVDLSSQGDLSSEPQVALNASGQAVAVWTRISGANADILAATLVFGGSWTAPVSLTSLGTAVNSPRVAINASGQAVALWCKSDGSYFLVEAATLLFGGGWSAAEALSSTGGNASAPALAFNDAGQTAAVWIREDVVQARTSTFGGAWGSGANLSKKPAVSSTFLLMDPYGNVRASWRRAVGEKTAYEMGTLVFGGSWTAPIFLTSTERPMDYVRIAFNYSGGAVVVWNKAMWGNELIFALTYDYSAWSDLAVLSQPGQNAAGPLAALNNAGQTLALWLRSNGSHQILQAAAKPI